MAEEPAAPAEQNPAPDTDGAPDTEATPAPDTPPREERRAQSLNSQFAALKRHQRDWGQTYSTQKSELDKREQAVAQKEQLFARAQAEAQQNPGQWLKAGNVDDARLDAYLKQRQTGQGGYDNRYDSLASELQGLRQSLAERDKRLEQFEHNAAQLQKDRYLDNVSREVKSAGDAYELINHYGAYQDVADCQALYFERTGERMSTEEAAERVEGILTSMREEEVRKALASPKLAKRLGWEPKNPEADAAAQAEAEPDDKPKQPPPRRGKQPRPRPAQRTDAKLTPEQIWEEKMRRVNGKGSQL